MIELKGVDLSTSGVCKFFFFFFIGFLRSRRWAYYVEKRVQIVVISYALRKIFVAAPMRFVETMCVVTLDNKNIETSVTISGVFDVYHLL